MITDTAIAPLKDLLEELSTKNHVRVAHYKAVKRPRSVMFYKKVMDEMSHESAACLPALVLHDSFRMMKGYKPIWLGAAIDRLGGELRSVTPNVRTNNGIDFCAIQLGGTATTQADYIGLSNNTSAASATNTSLNTTTAQVEWGTANATDAAASASRGEYTALGLARKQATYAHTNAVASYTEAATWTATSAITSVQAAGLFGGSARTAQGGGSSTTNVLFLENTFTATTLATNDQLTLTWTINI